MADASLDLTINERRAMKGYEPIAGGDVLYVSMGQIPLTDLSMPIEPDPEAAAAEAYGEPEPPEEHETPDDESI
jgi:hypothetical protein